MEKGNDKMCATHNESLLQSQKVLPHLKQAILQKQLCNN